MKENNDLPELMSVKELAKYFRCGITVAYDIVKKRGFPSFKVKGTWYIDKEKLSFWIKNQSTNYKY